MTRLTALVVVTFFNMFVQRITCGYVVIVTVYRPSLPKLLRSQLIGVSDMRTLKVLEVTPVKF
jgi:hypothetical protein